MTNVEMIKETMKRLSEIKQKKYRCRDVCSTWNCWLNNMQREVVEPYAWREITIPKFGLQGDCNK